MKSPLKAGSLLANPDTAAFAGEINSVATKGTSIVMDFIPVIGTGKGFYEAYTGVDSITGAELAWWERGINLIPLAGPMLRKGVKAAGVIGDALKHSDKADDIIDAASNAMHKTRKTVSELSGNIDQLANKIPGMPSRTGAYLEGAADAGDGLGRIAGRSIKVTEEGFRRVEKHLSQFDEFAPNKEMLNGLKEAMQKGHRITGGQASFYMHELYEANLMAKGVAYEVAHSAALAKYGVSPFSVYSADVVRRFPEYFNSSWFRFWGIE
jgi:hypothetical protein